LKGSHREVKERIEFEFSQIDKEFLETSSLFLKLKVEQPDAIELRAVASTLHAFYNGVENILLAIAKNIDAVTPTKGAWHIALLNQMSSASEKRQKVISETLRSQLEEYLGFRHFYRHSYAFMLDWDTMRPLVENIVTTFEAFKKEIRYSLDRMI